jgi:predicted phosphodiesterase
MGKLTDAELLERFRAVLEKHGRGIGQNHYDRLDEHHKPGRKQLIERFGSWEQARERALAEVEAEEMAAEKESIPGNESTELTEEYGPDKGTLCSKSRRITTLEELLEYAKVDLSVWEVDRFVINRWEVGAKDADNTIQVSPLYQIKVWLKRKAPEPLAEALKSILAEIKEHAPRYPVLPAPSFYGDKYLYEIAIFDLHLAKLCWDKETGENYDTGIAEERYLHAVADLMGRVQGLPIERIVLPTGSDLLHVDNLYNTTTSGTQQDVDSRWQRAFCHAHKMLVTAIDSLARVAPVDVLIVPGNHDRERAFYIGEVLAAWYRNCDRVTVDNSPTPRKYMRYGTNLIGFTHGSEEKMDSLPLIMARERKQDWAETECREIHLGHLHKKREYRFNAGDTFNGIAVRVIPSLCSADSWHNERGYIGGIRAAEAYLWSYESGYAGHFSSNVIEVK